MLQHVLTQVRDMINQHLPVWKSYSHAHVYIRYFLVFCSA